MKRWWMNNWVWVVALVAASLTLAFVAIAIRRAESEQVALCRRAMARTTDTLSVVAVNPKCLRALEGSPDA